MDKRIIYYEDLKGRKFVKEFIDSFDIKTKGKLLARIEFLASHWHELRRPYVDKIEADLYELQVDFAWNAIRVIYVYMFKDYIVLLHAFRKKTNKISEKDKAKATKRMVDFQIRYNQGKIRLR